jgi:hypothetical protein
LRRRALPARPAPLSLALDPARKDSLRIDLDWPTRITQSELFAWAKSRPKGESLSFLFA